MLNGFLWRFTCNSALATGSIEACQVLSTFLAHGKMAITPTSYFGAPIPGQLCLSFSYHFTVGDRWPSHLKPLEDLIKAPFLSKRTLDFDPLVIDLYLDNHSKLILITKDQKSTDAHKSQTPKSTYIPLLPACTATTSPQAPEQVTKSRSPSDRPSYLPANQFGFISAPEPPLSNTFGGGAALPPVSQLYSPPTHQQQSSSILACTPNHLLGPAFANALAPTVVPLVRKFNPLTSTILTDQGRSKASAKFLNCCCLLIHHNPMVVLTDTQQGHPLLANANLFRRQPTAHFQRDVLGPLSLAQTGFISNFYN
jgi:hypothetical protein